MSRNKSAAGGERMTVLHNVARSLVSMVRSSGIRKDYMIDDDHGAWFLLYPCPLPRTLCCPPSVVFGLPIALVRIPHCGPFVQHR